MKTLTFLVFCLPFFTQAATTLEEGLILQEELRFLEEVARTDFNPTIPKLSQDKNLNTTNDLDLESTYFRDSEDEVQTRSAAPRRRR